MTEKYLLCVSFIALPSSGHVTLKTATVANGYSLLLQVPVVA